MPELPEVERARRLLHSRCINKEITWVRATDDTMVFPEKRGHSLSLMLKGRRVIDTGRRGKQFWLVLSGGISLMMHFGMTGDIHMSDEADSRYRKMGVDVGGAWPPLYTKLEMEFGKELAVAFTDPRRLGKIRIFDGNAVDSPLVKRLGFDPILDPPGFEDFKGALAKRRAAIKALLLKQEFSAGIGNWIADEVLYQSKVHPAQPACSLTDTQARMLLEQIRSVCITAVEANADSNLFPPNWLFHHRWAKGTIKPRQPKMPNGQGIEFVTVAGRTSAFVPEIQVLLETDITASDTEDDGDEDDEESYERLQPPPSEPSKPRRKFRLGRAVE